MKKRILSLGMVAAMSISLLAACGGGSNNSGSTGGGSTSSSSGASNEGGEVTIQFMHQQVEEERIAVIDGIIADFEAANPGIKVEAIPVNEDDYDQKITTLAGSSELPAVIEFSQDQAKTSVSNQLIDTDAIKAVISERGESAFFDGALGAAATEDGASYVGVPVCGWVQGIWCNTAMLKEKGFDVPKNWDEVIEIAKAFYDPNNQMYGISLPTSDSAFTEQVFSQFALSNGANVLDGSGNVTINTTEMKEAAEFYKTLAGYSMPGSTEVADVRDAFVGQNAPMCMYSTYILRRCEEAGFLPDVQLALPTKTEAAAYGTVTVLSISNQISAEQAEAAKKFIAHLISVEGNEAWITMAPGGVQPVLSDVANDPNYANNEVITPFAHLLGDVGAAFDNLRLFGSVDGKNYMVMGDITNSGIISKALNNIIVQGADIEAELGSAQTAVEGLMN